MWVQSTQFHNRLCNGCTAPEQQWSSKLVQLSLTPLLLFISHVPVSLLHRLVLDHVNLQCLVALSLYDDDHTWLDFDSFWTCWRKYTFLIRLDRSTVLTVDLIFTTTGPGYYNLNFSNSFKFSFIYIGLFPYIYYNTNYHQVLFLEIQSMTPEKILLNIKQYC